MAKFIILNLLKAELYRTNADSLKTAIEQAVKSGAYLTDANLDSAYLTDANLDSANLTRANLTGANLTGANLTRANLTRAKGYRPAQVTPLLMLYDQIGSIRAYKLVKSNGEGPFNGGIVYELGKSYEVANANKDVTEHCGAGINLATLDWCLANLVQAEQGARVFIAEFTAADIAAIPTATDGKFRVRKCTIVGEKDLTEFQEKSDGK